jgi:outer membrane lipoprotein-sorting protein
MQMNMSRKSFYVLRSTAVRTGSQRGFSAARLSRRAGGVVCLSLSFVLLAQCAHPGQLSVDEILKKVSETYQQLQSFQIASEITTQVTAGEVRFNDGSVDNPRAPGGGVMYPSSPPPMKSEVDLAEMNPGKFRLQFKDTNSEVILVSDGLITWAYSPKKKQYTEKSKVTSAPGQSDPADKAEMTPVNQYESLLVNRFRDLPRYSSNFVMEKETQLKLGGDKVDCYVLKMVTPQGQHEIWVDKARFIVWRSVDANPTEVRGGIPYHKTLTVDLKTANLNAKLEDGLFKFAPPDKAKKVDSLNPQAK